MNTYSRPASVVCALMLSVFAVSASAVPVSGLIENDGETFSVVHPGANPGGAGDPATDWYWFKDGETFNFDFTDGIVTTDGLQSYELMSGGGTARIFDIVSLILDTNGEGGFAGGEMEYRVDGGNVRTFVFEDTGPQRNAGPGNSSSFDGVNFQAFLWSGDIGAELGIDFSFSAILGSTQINEPSVLALMGLGLLGFAAARRRRR